MSELRDQEYQFWKWAGQGGGSEHVRGGGASMSELWESQCAILRVVQASISALKDSMLKMQKEMSE